jgi:hypothetical protein
MAKAWLTKVTILSEIRVAEERTTGTAKVLYNSGHASENLCSMYQSEIIQLELQISMPNQRHHGYGD